LTNEKAYLLGKCARAALGTSNIDYNGRFCMSSAPAAGIKAFGIDRGLPFPLEDIPYAEAVLLVGGDIAETMPPSCNTSRRSRPMAGNLL
jgi:assimilatory nitrate reductase catalytic subunit